MSHGTICKKLPTIGMSTFSNLFSLRNRYIFSCFRPEADRPRRCNELADLSRRVADYHCWPEFGTKLMARVPETEASGTTLWVCGNKRIVRPI